MDESIKIIDRIEFLEATIDILTESLGDPENTEDLGNINYEIGQAEQELEKLLSDLIKNMEETISNEDLRDKLKTSIANAEQTIDILMEDLGDPENAEDVGNINYEIGELQKQIEEWQKQLAKLPQGINDRIKKL